MTRLLYPEPVEGVAIVWIAAVGILINAISAFLFYRNKEKDLNAKSSYLHLMADAAVSVGVVEVILMTYTGWYWRDPAIGLAITVVILISA